MAVFDQLFGVADGFPEVNPTPGRRLESKALRVKRGSERTGHKGTIMTGGPAVPHPDRPQPPPQPDPPGTPVPDPPGPRAALEPIDPPLHDPVPDPPRDVANATERNPCSKT
jgi:hypothetical protein